MQDHDNYVATYWIIIHSNANLVNTFSLKTHGNSIYFFVRKKILRSSSGLSEALNMRFFLLIRPVLAWLTRESAVLRRTFILSEELAFPALAASSRKITSKHQWSRFSIDQCITVRYSVRKLKENLQKFFTFYVEPFHIRIVLSSANHYTQANDA